MFVVVSFQWCTVFPSESMTDMEHVGVPRCWAPLSCDEYIFLINNPHSLDYEHNSNLKFLLFDDDDDDYISIFLFSSSVHCYENHCFILMDMLSVFYMLYWNISEIKRSLFHPAPFPPPYLKIRLIPPPLPSSWYPVGLTYSLPITVAVRKIRHGTTHCLNTVDHSRWSQETHPAKKNKNKRKALATFKASPQKAPHTPAGLSLLHLVFLCQ